MNDIRHLNNRMMRRLTIVAMLGCGLIPSCTLTEDKITEEIADIEMAIAAHHYDSAQTKLKKYSSLHDDYIYQYNHAVISIFAGKCDEARKELEAMLIKLEPSNEPQPQNLRVTSTDKEDQLNGQVHLGIAMAALCLANKETTSVNYEDVLAHLYTASTYGIDLDDAIVEVIHRWIPSCESFMEPWQINASEPENALELSSINPQELIICPSGVWVKIQARNHETISSSFDLFPLPRQIWLDDSAKLPFSQLQVDVFDHFPTNGDQDTVEQFSQPLPETLPPAEAYQTLNYKLRYVEFSADSVHYIHLYTRINGELKLHFHYKKDANCAFIDDLTTYTPELESVVTQLDPDKPLSNLLLCPSRPDHFSFSLKHGQYALITVSEQINDKQTNTPMANPLFQLYNQMGNLIYDSEDMEQDISNQTNVAMFKVKSDIIENPKDQDIINEYILIHNISNEDENYIFSLALPDGTQSVEYRLALSLSHDCAADKRSPTIPAALDTIEQTRSIQLPPVWICPNDILTYRPTLPHNMQLLRAKAEHSFITGTPLLPKDVVFSSFLHISSNPMDFLVENALDAASKWDNEQLMHYQVLLKPITSDTVFKVTTSENGEGFSLLTIQTSDEEKSQDHSKQSKDDNQSEDQQDQQDENQKQNHPNDSPDKPSETQT